MEHPTHEAYQKFVSDNLAKWFKRKSRAPKPELVDVALMLLRINLDPLRPMLELLYSDSPRGRPAFDPVRMFRALLLMSLLRLPSLLCRPDGQLGMGSLSRGLLWTLRK